MTLATMTLTEGNHTATILVRSQASLELFFDSAPYPIAVVRWDDDRNSLHMSGDAPDANADYATIGDAYAALLDWAQSDLHEMADEDGPNRPMTLDIGGTSFPSPDGTPTDLRFVARHLSDVLATVVKVVSHDGYLLDTFYCGRMLSRMG